MIKITKTPNADSRTAEVTLTKDILLKNSMEHIDHVRAAMSFFAKAIKLAGERHDWTKKVYIDEFFADATSGKFGKEFKAKKWFSERHLQERHHLLDRCPEDVNLIDVLERVTDITMAGLSRSGIIYDDEIDPDILVRAYKNTIQLLKGEVVVVNEPSRHERGKGMSETKQYDPCEHCESAVKHNSCAEILCKYYHAEYERDFGLAERDEIIKDLETENATLKEQLEAAKIPQAFKSAVGDLICALTTGGYSELTNAASYVWQMWDAWRGAQEGSE